MSQTDITSTPPVLSYLAAQERFHGLKVLFQLVPFPEGSVRIARLTRP